MYTIRTDQQIYDDLAGIFLQNEDIYAGNVELEVRGGFVTFTGTVESRDAMQLLTQLAQAVAGVKRVINRVRIQRFAEVGRANRLLRQMY